MHVVVRLAEVDSSGSRVCTINSMQQQFCISLLMVSLRVQGKSLRLRARRLIRPALISGFISMKRLGVFILPPGWDASPSQGYPQLYAGTHLYTWVERGTVRVKCLAQEHNTMSPARPRTRTTRSGVERTNHEATTPPTSLRVQLYVYTQYLYVRVAVQGLPQAALFH